jgi:hypothetical protein
LDDIIDDITLIKEKSYMLHIFNKLLDELTELNMLLDYEFKIKTTNSFGASQIKVVSLKDLIKDFSPLDQDN